MIDEKTARHLLDERIHDENLKRHMIAVGAVMKKLAHQLGEDPHAWEITGLLHDIDLGTTTDPQIHGNLGATWLEAEGLELLYCRAVKAHAGHLPADTRVAIALVAADQLTGLIIACALVKGRVLANVTLQTILKRFKEKRFAAGADRESILRCTELNMTLDAFAGTGLAAMQEISSQLGL
jgi:uncharacterized protein